MAVESKGVNAVVYWYEATPAPWGSARIRATSLDDVKPSTKGPSSVREGEVHQVLFQGQFYSAIVLEILDDTLLKELVWELHREDATRREKRGERQAIALGLLNKRAEAEPFRSPVVHFPGPPLLDNDESVQEKNVETNLKWKNISNACQLVKDVSRSDSPPGSTYSVGSADGSGRETPRTRARFWGRFKEKHLNV